MNDNKEQNLENQGNVTEEVISYKCKSCGSDLVFDPKTCKLLCSSCESSYFVSEFEKIENEEFEEIKSKTLVSRYNEEEVKEYNCDNCGAVLLTDGHTASTNCNYCGSPMLIAERLSGTIAPAQVIPFKFNQKDAQEAFKKWCKNGLLTPKDFVTEERIRNIEGLYVPFWLYDVNSTGEGEALCTRVRSYSTSSHNVTETKHYVAYRRVTADYVKIPVDASEKMDDKVMDLLEPFNYSELTKFNLGYLSGYSSEKYNYTDKQLLPRVKARSDEFIKEYMRSTIRGYSTVVLTNTRTDIRQRSAIYTMFPVYVVNYKYNDKDYNFTMNGQTGKIIGKPPVCIPKAIRLALITILIVAGVAEAIYWLVGMFL